LMFITLGNVGGIADVTKPTNSEGVEFSPNREELN